MEGLTVGHLVNGVLVLALTLLSLVLKQLWSNVRDLAERDNDLSNQITATERRLTDKMNELEVTVAQTYMPRSAIENKLDRLYDAVDQMRNLVNLSIATRADDEHK